MHKHCTGKQKEILLLMLTQPLCPFFKIKMKKNAEDPQDLFEIWKMHGIWTELSIQPI